MVQGSFLLNRELVEEAFRIAEPTIEKLLLVSNRPIDRRFIHIVILNTEEIDDPAYRRDDILSEKTFGPAPANRSEWKNEYDRLARAKAYVSRRTKQDSAMVASCSPSLFRTGDTHFGGGVYLAGVAGGGSGVEPELDEACTRIVISAIVGLVKMELKAIDKKEIAFFY